MKRILLSSALVLSTLSTPALCGSNDFYLGASFGDSDYDTNVSNLTGSASLDESDNGFKVFGGYRYNEFFAVEASYTDLGETSLRGNTGDTFVSGGTTYAFTANDVNIVAEGESFGIAAILSVKLGERFRPFARIGYQHWEVDASVTSDAGNVKLSDDGNDPFYGLGLVVDLTDSISLRAEYERYELGDDDNDFVSLGLSASF